MVEFQKILFPYPITINFFIGFTVVMAIQSFRMVANLEYLLVLSKVFMLALPSDESPSSSPATEQPFQAITKQMPLNVKTADEDPPQITVQISIVDPEIVLLANAKDKNTNALFLKVGKYNVGMSKYSHTPFEISLHFFFCFLLQNKVEFHFVQGHGQQKMAGSILDLVITSAAFDKERRKPTKSKVGASIIGHADSWRVSRVTNHIFFSFTFCTLL